MSSLKLLNQHSEWVTWVRENLARGCDLNSVKNTLIQNGFDPISIESVIKSALHQTVVVPSRVQWSNTRPIQGAPIYASSPTSSKAHHLSLGHASPDNAVFLQNPLNPALVSQVITSKMQLYLIGDFMSPKECQEIIDLGNHQLRPSTVSLPDQEFNRAEDKGAIKLADETYVDLSFRTSQTCDLALLNDPKVMAMDQRISKTLGIAIELSESTQLQRYLLGEQFKSHTDYFAPNSEEYTRFASERGNRTWTFMVYLNNVAQGGGTHFSAIEKTILPRQGMAVVWNNLLPSGEVNPLTIHAGTPVVEGVKFVVTKWFRQR